MTPDDIPEGALDTYGFPYTGEPRHPDRDCDVPCVMRFTCASSLHTGPRATPYCCGGDDAEDAAPGKPIVERCNDCWSKREKAALEREARRRAA